MNSSTPTLARKLGLFDATMLVIGGIVGAGIFMNPSVVAREVTTPVMILGAWIFGGLVAMAGAFVYAELASQRPAVGGQYAYLREAFHPAVAFLYGWGLLLVVQTGGMAAVGMTFARYFVELTGTRVSENAVAMLTLAVLTGVNCMGVRAGSNVQSGLTVLKMAAISFLIVAGVAGLNRLPVEWTPTLGSGGVIENVGSMGAAMIPVLFAYGGWQTACFIAAELKEPERDMPRGLVLGVLGVMVLYVSVNWVCLLVLGPTKLAATSAPASDIMRLVMGENGARLIALGITVSTLGFLSQGMLTAPRVYYAMAQDGLFFQSIGKVHPKTQAPVNAIALQGLCACIIAMTGSYGTILNYVVSVDFIFYGLTGLCLFIFRVRTPVREWYGSYHVPGHPFTTVFFIASCWAVVLATIVKYPSNSLIGLGILAAGLPVYFFWSSRKSRSNVEPDT